MNKVHEFKCVEGAAPTNPTIVRVETESDWEVIDSVLQGGSWIVLMHRTVDADPHTVM